MCDCTARFVSDLVGIPEDRFSHNEAHMLRPIFWTAIWTSFGCISALGLTALWKLKIPLCILGLHLGDNCIQICHLGRYIVGYTVGNFVLQLRNDTKIHRRIGKPCRPWSDCSSRSSLIRVCTVCSVTFVQKLRTTLLVTEYAVSTDKMQKWLSQ